MLCIASPSQSSALCLSFNVICAFPRRSQAEGWSSLCSLRSAPSASAKGRLLCSHRFRRSAPVVLGWFGIERLVPCIGYWFVETAFDGRSHFSGIWNFLSVYERTNRGLTDRHPEKTIVDGDWRSIPCDTAVGMCVAINGSLWSQEDKELWRGEEKYRKRVFLTEIVDRSCCKEVSNLLEPVCSQFLV